MERENEKGREGRGDGDGINREGARALDGPEGEELRDAEREGKAGAHKPRK